MDRRTHQFAKPGRMHAQHPQIRPDVLKRLFYAQLLRISTGFRSQQQRGSFPGIGGV
jgi:hypothetical protein